MSPSRYSGEEGVQGRRGPAEGVYRGGLRLQRAILARALPGRRLGGTQQSGEEVGKANVCRYAARHLFESTPANLRNVCVARSRDNKGNRDLPRRGYISWRGPPWEGAYECLPHRLNSGREGRVKIVGLREPSAHAVSWEKRKVQDHRSTRVYGNHSLKRRGGLRGWGGVKESQKLGRLK